MCQVGIESPPSLNGDAERLLGAIPLEVLQLDPSGRIIFANNRARQRLGIERTDPAANFFEIWEEDPQEVERRVLLAGHSSAWIPLSLTTRRGTEPGSQLLMKVRGGW